MKPELLGIIPAAGSGIRARPYTYEVHKGLFVIDGKPNLERLICMMRDDLSIKEIVITLGYMGEGIRERFGDGEAFGVKITYVENHHLDKGWAWSVLLAKPYLAGRYACVMLADEFYLNTNHAELMQFPYEDHSAVVTVQQTNDRELIKKNFSVELSGNRVIRLVENPTNTPNDILGMANFIISSEVVNLLEKSYDSGRTSVEFVNFIDELARDGHSVASFDIKGHYINLNDVSCMEDACDISIRDRLNKKQ
jgi:UDP-N-acetylglucosamine diphosphorylase / glucose-1-phosphate thymidylyltransferase / UDP-N-acetylgalactosamine diphosphorylase / glucosamine-1-phosphate N-acetyltransferase / galactosamine-1-phosphate N-acetyltransferase